MPRDGSGNYTLPAGNPVVSDTTIASTWANSTLADVQQGLTDSLDRQGRGGMLAPFKFVDGTVGAPGMAFTNEPASGFFRSGAGDVRWVIGGTALVRAIASGLQFFRAAAWRDPLDVAQDAAVTGNWTFNGVSVRDAGLINAGTFDAARIPNLDAGKISTGILAAARIPDLDAAKIVTGIFGTARIPNLDAAKITTGAFATARIPSLDAGKITTGIFADARIPNLSATKITSGTLADARLPTSQAAKQFASIELGHASDTTLTRLAAAKVGVEGKAVIKHTGAFTSGEVTVSTSAPSGGSDGDIWLRY